jgi:protein suppressor of PHYA-105 1
LNGAGSSAAAAAAAAPAAAGEALQQQQQQQQLQQPAAHAAAADDSDDDEMERREMSRVKRRRLAAAEQIQQQQQQQLLLERSGSANSGVAAATDGAGDAAAAAAAAAPAVVSQWQRVADRFPVLEGVYLKHRQFWEQQQQQQQEEGQKQQGGDAQQQLQRQPGSGASSSSSAGRQLPGYLQSFGEDLWGFSRYSGMAVRGTVRAAADVLGGGSAMVSTAAFDRDDEYLATAGVSKRIRIFEYAAITSSACGGGYGCAAGRAAAPGMGGYSGGSGLGFGGPLSPGRNAAVAGGGGAGAADGIVYPVLELSTRSRLSCVAWSSYVKAHLASSDHEGVVTLWDANTGGELVQFEEHSKRAWAVDFSRLEPTRLVSCSDDSTVKLWSVHEEGSLATLQLHANVCSVQFSPESPHLLACGCANYRTYLFDLRNTAQPLACTHGHRRAVSYVRWLGGEQLVTASTDNTLKLWSVPALAAAGTLHCAGGREASASAASAACITTYAGHLNQRNFIGLAVLPGSPGNSSSAGLGCGGGGSSSRPVSGYIVCGSETNEVYAYHTSMPVPVAAHSFSWPAGGGAGVAAAGGGRGGVAGRLAAGGFRGAGVGVGELDLLHGEHGEGAGGIQQQGENFVSCVAWNRRQGTIVAGNSAGHIKVLELV